MMQHICSTSKLPAVEVFAATQIMQFLTNGIFMDIWWLKYQFSFTNVLSMLFSTLYNDLGTIVWKKSYFGGFFENGEKFHRLNTQKFNCG